MIEKFILSETDNSIFYDCYIKKWICPKCDRHYEKEKKKCQNKKCSHIGLFKVRKEVRTGWIKKETGDWSCDCVFGSWYKWGEHWKTKYPESRCRHSKRAFKEWTEKQVKKYLDGFKEKLRGNRHKLAVSQLTTKLKGRYAKMFGVYQLSITLGPALEKAAGQSQTGTGTKNTKDGATGAKETSMLSSSQS